MHCLKSQFPKERGRRGRKKEGKKGDKRKECRREKEKGKKGGRRGRKEEGKKGGKKECKCVFRMKKVIGTLPSPPPTIPQTAMF